MKPSEIVGERSLSIGETLGDFSSDVEEDGVATGEESAIYLFIYFEISDSKLIIGCDKIYIVIHLH